MEVKRIEEIIESSDNIEEIYEKLSDNELQGVSLEEFKNLVEAPDDTDEELSEQQMEEVAGGHALFDDAIKYIAKKAREKIRDITKDW